ncbi:hypothetical protein M427DRAFT_56325 [Gonapodya prolifera JEL478]|uniref:Uncharacterized protein n=1 Tax=Gonapodya prolifera (strain JEL478) TaxID=1344416 RepID=A0A139AGV6_GONPJ|nr:hypothetical protein M427DRAFT_56320 [Gonapodya prolifera JEL478]KXS16036.1 hypothetical protein M427DRAFT_56325 [Gonapodya prolifera JEL478]|eukprot:KXS16027.1 hypothetical protein M427DRAFT_56320 [Gonapodya prolifera JEL478]
MEQFAISKNGYAILILQIASVPDFSVSNELATVTFFVSIVWVKPLRKQKAEHWIGWGARP